MSVRVGWSAPQADTGRHPPPSSSSAPALIGNLSGSSCACLTSGWPIGRYWSRPPGPNRRYSPNTNRCFKPRPVTKPTLPISALLRPILATWHLPHYLLLHAWAAQLPEIYTICMRMSIKSTFPPGSPASAPPLFLTPGRSHLNPSHFQLSRAVPSNSRLQRKASSTRVLGSCCAAALPQSCFFVSPTQQSRAAGKAHSRRQGRCLTLDIQITLFPWGRRPLSDVLLQFYTRSWLPIIWCPFAKLLILFFGCCLTNNNPLSMGELTFPLFDVLSFLHTWEISVCLQRDGFMYDWQWLTNGKPTRILNNTTRVDKLFCQISSSHPVPHI